MWTNFSKESEAGSWSYFVLENHHALKSDIAKAVWDQRYSTDIVTRIHRAKKHPSTQKRVTLIVNWWMKAKFLRIGLGVDRAAGYLSPGELRKYWKARRRLLGCLKWLRDPFSASWPLGQFEPCGYWQLCQLVSAKLSARKVSLHRAVYLCDEISRSAKANWQKCHSSAKANSQADRKDIRCLYNRWYFPSNR